MKKVYLTIAVILVMVSLSVYGCSSTTTVFQRSTTTITQTVPSTVYVTQTIPTTNPYIWDFTMDNLQKVAIYLSQNNESQSFVKHPDDGQFYFDTANGTEVDFQRWVSAIPLLLSGPGASRLTYQNASNAQLVQCGFNTPIMNASLTLSDGNTYVIQVGSNNTNSKTYYAMIANNNDVYTVDKFWYDELSAIVTDPPYIGPATFEVSSLTVWPDQLPNNGTVNISVIVTNNGNIPGSFDVPLFINSKPQKTETVTLAARSSQVVSFNIIVAGLGARTVSINNLSGQFVVQ